MTKRKNTKPHSEKKTPQAHEAWVKRKRDNNCKHSYAIEIGRTGKKGQNPPVITEFDENRANDSSKRLEGWTQTREARTPFGDFLDDEFDAQQSDIDMEFIAESRSDVPALLHTIEVYKLALGLATRGVSYIHRERYLQEAQEELAGAK